MVEVQVAGSEREVLQAVERELRWLEWMFPGGLNPHLLGYSRHSLGSHSPSSY
jgi:hypothetical protein